MLNEQGLPTTPPTYEPLPPVCLTEQEQLVAEISEALPWSLLCTGIRQCSIPTTKLNN